MNRKNTPLLILIFVALVIFMLTSCVQNGTAKDPFAVEVAAKSTELDSTSEYYDKQYEVYTLEGCEYIVVGVGKMQWGSHKGNCKNPIHKENGN
jgi:hypothetical protein